MQKWARTQRTTQVSKFSTGISNKEGARLLDFARSNNLKFQNSLFMKRKSRKWTWVSPNGRTRNEIDHCLSDLGKLVSDYSILSSFEFASDHRIGRCTIKIPKRLKVKNYRASNRDKVPGLVIPKYTLEGAIERTRQKN